MLTKPTERLKKLQVKLSPMLGCIGVALRNAEAFPCQPPRRAFEGNMDYLPLGISLVIAEKWREEFGR